MGTQKVHCRGGAQHARPCGSRSAPGSMTSIDPYMQKRMLASAETKEKPLAERIGKGLSLVRGTGLEPVTSCTSSMRSNWVEYFPVVVIVLYIDFVIFINVQFAHKCIYIIPQYHNMSTKIASQYPKKENHGRSRIFFPNLRKKWGGRLKKGALLPV